jgi:multidrug efflux pump
MDVQKKSGFWAEIFVKKPVLAATLSILILVVGIFGASKMAVREYPALVSAVLTVSTSYPGASPQTVQSYITEPISRVLGSVPGLDYMTSGSSQGGSVVTLHMKLNTDPNAAQTNALVKIKQVEALLPKGAFPPVVQTSSGRATALMYIAFYSTKNQMSTSQIVDYVVRNVQPAVQTVSGVSDARIIPGGSAGGNGNNLAVRIWLDPLKMAARHIGADTVSQALADQNVIAPVGDIRSELINIPLTSNLGLTKLSEFKNLGIETHNGVPIYLKDIANV